MKNNILDNAKKEVENKLKEQGFIFLSEVYEVLGIKQVEVNN